MFCTADKNEGTDGASQGYMAPQAILTDGIIRCKDLYFWKTLEGRVALVPFRLKSTAYMAFSLKSVMLKDDIQTHTVYLFITCVNI